MSNVTKIETAMTGADKAFQILVERMKQTYDELLDKHKLKKKDKKGVPLLYDDLFCVAGAITLASMKATLFDQYMLLVMKAGSEAQLIENTLSR